jgi:hypothetical protein
MLAVETIVGEKFDKRTLDKLAARGDELIASCALKHPIRVSVFSRYGCKVTSFTLDHRDDDHDLDVNGLWEQSAQGVILKIEDCDGKVIELSLVVNSVQNASRTNLQ